jgi:NNP family nitrate/nitrite transporter-like MFS transporter
LFGFLFKSSTITYVQAFTYIGYIVIAVSVIIFITRFNKVPETKTITPDAALAGSVA